MKKIIIPILMLLCLIGIASAATVVNMDPMGLVANNTYLDSTIQYNVNVTGNNTAYRCYLYTNENGTNGVGGWKVKSTAFPVANNTNTIIQNSYDVADVVGFKYSWAVKCNTTTLHVANSSTTYSEAYAGTNSSDYLTTGDNGYNYSVDITDPVITIHSPTANSWSTTGNMTVNINVTDSNAATCILGTNMDFAQDANNTGSWNASTSSSSYTTLTAFSFTDGQANIMVDNGTGDYSYQITCNDSAGNEEIVGNYTVYVDKTPPGVFLIDMSRFYTDHLQLWNATTATDHTPQVAWTQMNNASFEQNFSRMEVTFYQYTFENATYIQKNTTGLTNATNITTLVSDANYFIKVTAYDLAGNHRNATIMDYEYTTDSTNYNLSAGWNIIGNTGNNFTLSQILNWTGATTASIWNTTHEFNSHVASGSYGNYDVETGTPVLLYMGAKGNANDLIWNTTAIDIEGPNSLANQSTSNWNLVMNQNSTEDNFELIDLDLYLNGDKTNLFRVNVSTMSYYNNSASIGNRYVSYLGNWSQSMAINSTQIEFGECAWMYLDLLTVATLPMNWSEIK